LDRFGLWSLGLPANFFFGLGFPAAALGLLASFFFGFFGFFGEAVSVPAITMLKTVSSDAAAVGVFLM
jgi:hypothetical protein